MDPPPRRVVARARAIAEAIFATVAGPPPAARLDWLLADFGDFAAHAGPRARLVLALCSIVVTWLAPLMVWRLPPLARLTVTERAEAIERLERTPLSVTVLGIKAILCILYYEHPDAMREIGVDRTCLTSGEPETLAAVASEEQPS